MTRYTSKHKAETKLKILKESEAVWKSEGHAAATVERIMASAGLTVGGFYGHFQSKESLLTETLKFSLRQGYQRLFGGIETHSKKEWLAVVVRRYLSQVHHKDLRTACPLPLLTQEMARSKTKIKKTFNSELSDLLDGVLEHMNGDSSNEKKAKILAVLSSCVGAVVIARALGDSPIAQDMLKEVEAMILKGDFV